MRHKTIFATITCVLLSASASAQWVNYRVPGTPRTQDGKPDLTAPARKAADGKPDLSGVWITKSDYFKDLATDLKPGTIQMLPDAKCGDSA